MGQLCIQNCLVPRRIPDQFEEVSCRKIVDQVPRWNIELVVVDSNIGCRSSNIVSIDTKPNRYRFCSSGHSYLCRKLNVVRPCIFDDDTRRWSPPRDTVPDKLIGIKRPGFDG